MQQSDEVREGGNAKTLNRPKRLLASMSAHLTCVWRIFLCLRLLAGDGLLLHFLCGRAGREGIAALAPTHITLLIDIVSVAAQPQRKSTANALDSLGDSPTSESPQILCYRLRLDVTNE